MKTVTLVAILVGLVASASAMLFSPDVPANNPAPYFARITYQTDAAPLVVVTRAGSIISDRFILTTNEIPVTAFNIDVFVGSNLRVRQRPIPGSAVIPLSTLPFSPALIQLLTPLVFSPTVNMIRLYPEGRNIGVLNQQGFVVGNGNALPPGPINANLQVASMRITDRVSCLGHFPQRIGNAFFCAFDAESRSDFCVNDIGSGFTMISRGEEVLVGVAIQETCNSALNRPALFASISYFRDQIYEYIGNIQPFEE